MIVRAPMVAVTGEAASGPNDTPAGGNNDTVAFITAMCMAGLSERNRQETVTEMFDTGTTCDDAVSRLRSIE